MTCIITIDGICTKALISCHQDRPFSYHNGVDWVRKARTVPRRVLDDPTLPEEERLRVRSRMAELGVSPS